MKFKYLKGKINIMKESVDIQIGYAKDEVDIKAESLKIEIDEMKNSFINRLDNIGKEFREYLIIFVTLSDLNKFF